jgi:DNA-binding LacI/PurR family transcriptional regulator
MAISIRDVAARAGVSAGTVSHVLNGNQAARIAAETQDRVRRAASELGYRPNRVARSLGRRRTDTIGLLLGGLRNPFFVEVLESLEIESRRRGYHTLLEAAPSLHGTFGGHGLPPDYWPVDGVLMWTLFGRPLTDVLGDAYAETPVVYLGTEQPTHGHWVAFDYRRGGRLAAERLLTRGCRRPAYVTPYAYGVDRHDEPRHIGFHEVWVAAGVEPRMVLTREEETRAAGVRAGMEIAALPAGERPDGVFCHNDLLAVGVCVGLRRAGLRIPEDVAVVGHDGIEEGQYLEAPLTTVALPVTDFCRLAVDKLVRRLEGANGTGDGGDGGVVLPPALRPGGTA